MDTDFEKNHTIRVPYNTIDSISKILYYQNEQLLYEIAKHKGWNANDIIKKYLVSIQNRIEVTNEKYYNDGNIKEISKEDDNETKCYARTSRGLYTRCTRNHKKGYRVTIPRPSDLHFLGIGH